ncbi:predicted protein [Sclerotinia sclerotiorum 1980 UF-70]|uniref:Uncharacterized protein n=1 Tax=Sclerotinia sclerotiorum (strain ATCC 18683 / 1980 / Ss-1) TaxID=665079 RepID=A7EAW7_SCLS1|nr:predicted protein [Sclerotinia sclerotiorum 1980 UF-70]EDN99595.1 predicted protein [Sclerotinia sclerotiorum 1980 UF-70]
MSLSKFNGGSKSSQSPPRRVLHFIYVKEFFHLHLTRKRKMSKFEQRFVLWLEGKNKITKLCTCKYKLLLAMEGGFASCKR